VAARSKAWVWGRSPAEIMGSNPTGAWMFVWCKCCVLSGRGLCDELITRPEESYRLWSIVVCDLEISVRRSTCFRRFFRPSSGAQNCTYSVRPLLLPAASLARLAAGSSNGLTLYVQFWAPDDGRKDRLKHVECLTEINKLWNVASCWLYSANYKHVSVKV